MVKALCSLLFSEGFLRDIWSFPVGPIWSFFQRKGDKLDYSFLSFFFQKLLKQVRGYFIIWISGLSIWLFKFISFWKVVPHLERLTHIEYIFFYQLEKLVSEESLHYDIICFHYYIQFHLHLQVSRKFLFLFHQFFAVKNVISVLIFAATAHLIQCPLSISSLASCQMQQLMQEITKLYWKGIYQ